MKQYRYKLFDFFVHLVEQTTKKYITFHARPIYSDKIKIGSLKIPPDYSDYAIVIQGPILAKNNFTLETLRLYKKFFPTASLILSTWQKENKYCINEAKKIGIHVIENSTPTSPGPLNINMQLISTKAGIEYALKMKKKYVLKTRTDVRMYNHNALLYLSNLLIHFPLSSSHEFLQGRLLSIHSKTGSQLYWFPDQLVFGHTKDTLLYFDINLLPTGKKLSENPHIRHAEQYLFTEFLKKIGYQLTYTPENSMRAQANYTLITDATTLDWYWHKYKRYLEYRYAVYIPKKKKHHMGFTEWLNLYTQYRNKNL